MRKAAAVFLGAVLLATAIWQTLPTGLPAPLVTAAPIRITIPPLPTTAPTPARPPLPTTTTTDAVTTAVPGTPLSPSPTPTTTLWPTPLPASVQLTGLTNIPQKFNNCGPTNLSLTLAYHGLAVDQRAPKRLSSARSNSTPTLPWLDKRCRYKMRRDPR